MNLTFLNAGESADPFVVRLLSVMGAAARDLGIDLEVENCGRDAERVLERARSITERGTLPDVVVLSNELGATGEALPLLDAAGARTFVINEGLTVAERGSLGMPREKFDGWIGELVPDEQQAGALLAEELLRAAEEAGLHGSDGKIQVCGLAGSYTYSAIHRLNGLRTAIGQNRTAVLHETVPAGWDREKARARTVELLTSHPETGVVWAASDLMAIGAMEAIEASGRTPGRDVLVGGIDWTEEACRRVEDGSMAVTVGGHFYDGAWALILLYDFHHGIDFEKTSWVSSFLALTRMTGPVVRPLLEETTWQRLDFRQFSRALDPDRASYDFSMEALLDALGAGSFPTRAATPAADRSGSPSGPGPTPPPRPRRP